MRRSYSEKVARIGYWTRKDGKSVDFAAAFAVAVGRVVVGKKTSAAMRKRIAPVPY